MSVEINVAVMKDRLPDRDAWQQALHQLDFPLVLWAKFLPDASIGYVPVSLQALPSGFEYYLNSIDASDIWLKEVRSLNATDEVFELDHIVQFVVRDDHEIATAMCAAAALAYCANGQLFDDDQDCFVSAEKAIALARETLADI